MQTGNFSYMADAKFKIDYKIKIGVGITFLVLIAILSHCTIYYHQVIKIQFIKMVFIVNQLNHYYVFLQM